jgi:hypothetical protein
MQNVTLILTESKLFKYRFSSLPSKYAITREKFLQIKEVIKDKKKYSYHQCCGTVSDDFLTPGSGDG